MNCHRPLPTYDEGLAVEDSNAVEASAAPTGVTLSATDVFFDDIDGTRPADWSDYYTYGTFSGAVNDWHQPESNRSNSPSNAPPLVTISSPFFRLASISW